MFRNTQDVRLHALAEITPLPHHEDLPPFAVRIRGLAGPIASGANPVLTWNEEVINTTRLSHHPPPIASQHLARFHAAIYDTAISFTRTHEPWLNREPAPDGADMDAAIAATGPHGTRRALAGRRQRAQLRPRLLQRCFRTDDIEFHPTSDGLPGAVRSFGNLAG